MFIYSCILLYTSLEEMVYSYSSIFFSSSSFISPLSFNQYSLLLFQLHFFSRSRSLLPLAQLLLLLLPAPCCQLHFFSFRTQLCLALAACHLHKMTVAWYISGSKCVSLVKLRQNFVWSPDECDVDDDEVNDKSREQL